jgi:two-component system sensor kinase FixL
MSLDSITAPVSHKPAFRVAAIYTVIGALWVLLSDKVLGVMVADLQTIIALESYKGWVFVLLTGILIYYLVDTQAGISAKFQQQLRERDGELRLTFQNAPTAIITFDMQGRFLSVNQSACELFGYTEQELRGVSYKEITHEEDAAESDQLLQQCARGDLKTYTYETRYVHKDMHVIHGRVHNGTVYGSDGRPSFLVAQVEDLTHRRKAEHEAREHRERLAHVDRVSLLGEMAAGIAHEINQPLTAISNYADAARRRVLADSADPAKLLKSLEKVSEQAHRAGEVIRRLRSLVKKGTSQRDNCNINDLLRDSVKLAAVDARIRDVSIEVNFQAGSPRVFVDQIQIQQVILNLLRNAVDATESDPDEDRTVRATTEIVDGELIEVSVEDQGVGVTDAEAEKLFSPFFTTKKAGMGMGLSISHSIINAHGGHLWFSSNEQRGTTFHFTLPIEHGEHNE